MRTRKFQLGVAEYLTLAGLFVGMGVAAAVLVSGWPIALVPVLTYFLALTATYLLYRQYSTEKKQAQEIRTLSRGQNSYSAISVEASGSTGALVAMFEVVDTRGVCPLGLRRGDSIVMYAEGSVIPQLCSPAMEVLGLAAKPVQGQEIKKWCCPIFDHFLVFEKVPKAA
ncbi:MAG: hypothetical protein HY666_06155 [Chloroflexi bacterium]|nr:hypothetical protein [Chloroflexota bacterium]